MTSLRKYMESISQNTLHSKYINIIDPVPPKNQSALSIFSKLLVCKESDSSLMTDNIPVHLLSCLSSLLSYTTDRDESNTILVQLGTLLHAMGVYKYYIAGGCFRSILNNEIPRDIDVFFSIDDYDKFKELFSTAYLLSVITDNKLEFKISSKIKTFVTGFSTQDTLEKWRHLKGIDSKDMMGIKKEYLSVSLSIEGFLPNIQLICFNYTDYGNIFSNKLKVTSPRDLINTFDFACVGFGVEKFVERPTGVIKSISDSRFYMHPDFLYSNISKALLPINSNGFNYNSCSLLRLQKYLIDYGFRLEKEFVQQYDYIMNCSSNASES